MSVYMYIRLGAVCLCLGPCVLCAATAAPAGHMGNGGM